MTIWEYKIEVGASGFGGTLTTSHLLSTLEKVGGEGWELAGVFPTQSGEAEEVWFVFKRPMEIKNPTP